MTDVKANVYEALSAVMGDVQAVKKGDRNTQQNFIFRGVDAVVNVVGPVLRKHGVIVVPHSVEEIREERYLTGNDKPMHGVILRITWRFYGPDGTFIEASSLGEAADAGDKASTKAHSVAYRTMLLQALCIPTDEPDPDLNVHERAEPKPDPRTALFGEIKAAGYARKLTDAEIAADFTEWSQGVLIVAADADTLTRYYHHLNEPVTP